MLTFIISLWDKQRDLPGDANHKESIQHRHQQPKALAGEIPWGQKWSLLYHKPIWIENGLQGTLVKLLFSENRSHGAIKTIYENCILLALQRLGLGRQTGKFNYSSRLFAHMIASMKESRAWNHFPSFFLLSPNCAKILSFPILCLVLSSVCCCCCCCWWWWWRQNFFLKKSSPEVCKVLWSQYTWQRQVSPVKKEEEVDMGYVK